MVLTFCVKEKKKTETKDIHYLPLAHRENVMRLAGICVDCGAKKSALVSRASVPQAGES